MGRRLLWRAFLRISWCPTSGATMQLLPRQAYLRLSSALQVAACCLFVGLYFLEPPLESHQALAAPENNALLRWLPAYWFLGLFQQLNGSMSVEFAPLAHRAWLGLVIAMCAALGVVLAAYFPDAAEVDRAARPCPVV